MSNNLSNEDQLQHNRYWAMQYQSGSGRQDRTPEREGSKSMNGSSDGTKPNILPETTLSDPNSLAWLPVRNVTSRDR